VTVGRAVLVLATAAAIALCVRALVREPPPFELAIAAFGGYLALVVLGVVFSRWGMFARVLCRGPRGARGVALTFDDGPDPTTTPRVLRLLEAAHVHAAFFVIGSKAEAHPDIVADIVAHGHVLGLHGYRHHRLLSLRSRRFVREDLARALAVVERITGTRPRMFRPPVGPVSPPMARAASELGLAIVGWSVKGLDGWSRQTASRLLDRVVPRLRDRAIVLLHDAAERGDFVPAGIEALPEILRVAEARGLEFVRVDHWLESSGPPPSSASEGASTVEATRSPSG
jgi:peptidoglycan/xylan/chitin deacetylase (PgdA/CDA1 family)